MSMQTTTTEALTTVRTVADAPRTIEGIAVPYGVVSGDTEMGREAFYPGAFRGSVDHWMSRQDGAKMAFRPAHKQDPIGVVTDLRDTPEGVMFRAKIRPGQRGDDYLAQVDDGLNGVSIEAGLSPTSKRGRDGTVIHREARLFAIAGSVSPAYDGARIALRDMEAMMAETEPIPDPKPEPAPAPTPAPEPEPGPQTHSRDAVQRDPVIQAIQRQSPAYVMREEAVYSRGSGHSFLADLQASHQGNSEARERQARHNAHLTDIAAMIERAGDVVSSEIPGAYPNDYLPGLLTPRILKGRPMGGFYNRVPISDAQPKIFPKVTTSTTVAVQSAEGTNPAASDLATTAVTATPLLYGAETVVSRQVLDGGSPSAQDMIIADMIEAYAQASETVIKTAVEAGATASGSAITAATPYAGLQANVVAYQAARFKPALGQFVPPALYTVALAQADTTGRPFYTYINPVNSQATVEAGGASGNILGATEYLSWASTTNVVVTGRPEDYVIFESSIARFSYDAVTGPAGVRIGIWAYLVVGTRLGSLKVTAA
jgi:phage head maturation protease